MLQADQRFSWVGIAWDPALRVAPEQGREAWGGFKFSFSECTPITCHMPSRAGLAGTQGEQLHSHQSANPSFD